MNSQKCNIVEQMQLAENKKLFSKRKHSKQLKKWFLDCDTFGHQVQLGFENHLVHKTYLGSCLTFLLGVLLMILIYVSLTDIIQKKNPTILHTEILISQQDYQLELPLDFVFAIAFQDIISGTDIDPEGIFKLTVQNVHYQQNQYTAQDIVLERCQSKHFTDKSRQLFPEIAERSMICVQDPKLFQKLKMFGQVGDDYYNDITFQLDMCNYKDDTSPVKCKYSLEQTQKIIDNTRIQIYFTDFLFNPNDYLIPYSIFKRTISQDISTTHSSYVDIFFTETYTITDSGYITSDLTKQKYPSFYKINKYTEGISNHDDDPLFLLQSSVEPKGDLYERSYLKLYVFLGTVGGFLKSLFSIFSLISTPFVKLSLKTEIVNRIFNFQQTNEDEIQEDDRKQLRIKTQNADCSIKRLDQRQANTIINQADITTPICYINQTHQSNHNLNKISLATHPKPCGNSINSIDQNKPRLSNLCNSENKITQIGGQEGQIKVKMPQSNVQIDQIKLQIVNENDESSQQMNLSGQKYLERKQRRSTTKLIHTFFKTAVVTKEQGSPLNLELPKLEQIKEKKDQNEQTMKSQQKINKQVLKKTEEDLNNDNLEDIDSVFKKLFKSNEQILKMKCLDYVSYFLNKLTFGCFKFNKTSQVQSSMKKVSERMDIIFILKKLIEVDKLKMLLLSEDQRRLFDYLPRPVVNLNMKQQNQSRKSSLATDINQSIFEKHQGNLYEQWNNMLLQQESGYFQKCMQAYFAFQNIKLKQNKDTLDHRLLDFMDPHKKKFFNTDHADIMNDQCLNKSVSLLINDDNRHNTGILERQCNQRQRKRSHSMNNLPSQKGININEDMSINSICEEIRIPNEQICEANLSNDIKRNFKFHTLINPYNIHISTHKQNQVQ